MTYNFEKFDKDALTKPRDLAWDNWKSWGDEVGDKVQGYIRDVFYRPAEGDFREQRGITLEQTDGTFVNVGIKRLSFVLAPTNELRLGDPLTMVLSELKPNGKAKKPTKIFAFYGTNLPENKDNKTVAELEQEDMRLQNIAEDEDVSIDKVAAELSGTDASPVERNDEAF
jgi:hypothetical protein